MAVVLNTSDTIARRSVPEIEIRIPEYDGKNISSGTSIFLAGPTRRGSCYEQSWRKEAVDILDELGYHGVVYVPEFPRNCPWSDDYILDQTA